jgi:hypothetical protein
LEGDAVVEKFLRNASGGGLGPSSLQRVASTLLHLEDLDDFANFFTLLEAGLQDGTGPS